jgi:hypothetical protein
MIRSVFGKFLSSSSASPRASKHTFTPGLETLENRLVPAASVEFSGGALTVHGDYWADDSLVIKHNGDGGVNITDANGLNVSHVGVNELRVETHFGNDIVRYAMDGSLQRDLNMSVFLGPGNDRFTGTLNRDMLSNADLSMYVDGDGGADRLSLYGTPSAPARSGDGLTDGLAINTGGLRIGSQASLFAHLYGDDDNDRVYFDYLGELDGNLNLRAEGGNGDDNVGAYLTLLEGSTGALGSTVAAVRGYSGNDNLSFGVIDHSNGGVTLGALRLNGGTNPFWMPIEFDAGFFTSNVTEEQIEGGAEYFGDFPHDLV